MSDARLRALTIAPAADRQTGPASFAELKASAGYRAAGGRENSYLRTRRCLRANARRVNRTNPDLTWVTRTCVRPVVSASDSARGGVAAPPQPGYTRTIANNLLKLWPALWTFTDHDGFEPTNRGRQRWRSLAERLATVTRGAGALGRRVNYVLVSDSWMSPQGMWRQRPASGSDLQRSRSPRRRRRALVG
jgi:hypothetical protein